MFRGDRATARRSAGLGHGRWLAILLLVAATGLPGCHRAPAAAAPDLRPARQALAGGDFDRAELLAKQVPEASPLWPQAALIAGEAAGKSGRIDEAVRQYRSLGEHQQGSHEQPLGYFYAGELLRDAGRLTEAERFYRTFLDLDPANALAHERLAFLTGVSGRRWESAGHLFALVRSGTATVEELVLFADLDRPIEQRPFLEQCLKKAPDDLLVRQGLACDAFWEGNVVEALPRLQAIVAADPDRMAAQTLLGELLINQPDNQFRTWHKSLPKSAGDDPDLWYVRGLWTNKQNRPQVAARCFWESIRLAPTHRRATFQLGQSLRSIGHPASGAVEARSRQLIQLTQEIDQVLRSQSRRAEPLRNVALLLEQMGRVWEAGAWGVAARKSFPEASWPHELLSRVAGRLNEQLPLVIDRENLALQIDLSTLPGFDSLLNDTDGSAPADNAPQPSTIRFTEADNGPEFTYWNGADPQTPGARQFEQTGGGVGVLDFDGDGWPDLFFPQGLDWRTGSAIPDVASPHTDRLFRNHRGERWLDVTAAAGIQDSGFGQGCAAGDFDNDGFQDLYVANVGRNQLLRNNGDGTFADVTAAAGLDAADWTTSCVMVDLNADGAPDLFDVNYLTGPGVYEAICQGHACSPSVFAGAEDRCSISRGDGTFGLLPRKVPEIDGKGLGVVAFNLHESGRPALLIANDQVPNFLLRNETIEDGFGIELVDEAFQSGVAFNQDGLAMAAMGIAADDVDGDGRMDFYVTTFKDESSLLFVQTSPGLFVDQANLAGLRQATWPFVGWGAQFLDADLDGQPDLVNVNGHVDDYRAEGGEYHMRPQFFRNMGGGRFAELPAAELGPFFSRKQLGRGLARLDWNRDGRMDFAVSHIGARAGLVTNETPQVGSFLNVCLYARQTARDAIGATVEVEAGGRRWTKQLVAGDGYMASNERFLQFGLGPVDQVDTVQVRWPSGATSVVRHVGVNRTLELAERNPTAILRETPEHSTVIEMMAEPGDSDSTAK